MRTWARRTAGAAMFTASFVAAGTATTGLALAGTTSGNNSVGGGNQASAPISIPVNVCGNALALLGGSFASCAGGAWTQGGGGSGVAGSVTSGNNSILGGNQFRAPVRIPVNVCGNAVGGNVHAGCVGGAWTGTSGGSSSSTGFTMHSNFTRALASSSKARAAGVQAPLTGALGGLTSNLPWSAACPASCPAPPPARRA